MIVRPERRSERRRGAITLIEVLGSITISAVLLVTTATVMTLLFRLDRLGRDELTATIAEGRLAADLRDDVRSALDLDLDLDLEPPPDAPAGALTLDLPSGQVVSYRTERDDLIRVTRGKDNVDRIERYRLMPGTVARWQILGAATSRRVVLELDAPRLPKATDGGRRLLRIEATLGRDHRHEGNPS